MLRIGRLAVLLVCPLAACAPVYYAPNVANAPLLRDKGDIQVSGHFGGGDEVKHLVQGNLAWSFTRTLGLYASAYAGAGSYTDSSGKTNSGSGSEVEVGLGYHRMSRSRFGLEGIGGILYGSGSNTYKNTYTVQYSARKPYLQLTLGYRGRFFEAVLAQRVSRLTYSGITEARPPVQGGRPSEVSDLMAAKPIVLYEPTVSLRFGRDPVKVSLDLGGINKLSNTPVVMDKAMVAFGIRYAFMHK